MPELSVREAVSRWISEGRRIAAASVVTIEGSSPHAKGLALVVNDVGEIAGAVSGGCIDGEIVEACEQVLKTDKSKLLQFGSDKNVFSNSLVCGGKIEVRVYVLSKEIAHALLSNKGNQELVLIIGESAFTDMLCRLARMLNYEVIVCEPRRRFAESIVSADSVDESWPNECIKKLIAAGRLDSGSVIIICTHDRKFDEPALVSAVRSKAGFIGAFGSRRTVEDRRTRLLGRGLSELEISRIRSPLGFDLGNETAAETAVSVFAEIIALKNKRSGKALTELSGAIHSLSPCF